MIKVLSFCDYMYEPLGGGAEVVSAHIYRRLAVTNEFSIEVLTGVPRSRGRRGRTDVAGPDVAIEAHRGLDLSRLVGAQLSVSPSLYRHAKRRIRRDRPDVIHASSIHFFGSLVAARVAKKYDIPLVTTCHLSGLEALPRRTRRLGAFYERVFGRYILERSHRVIAVSDTVREHVLSLGVAGEDVEVIENGVDAEVYAPAQRDPSKIVVTFVGRLIANKGPIEVVEAFRDVEGKDVRLLMVGDGPLETEVQEAASGDPRISLLGHRDDVDALLAHSNVFVRLSTTEGRSLAALEAMAAGCAVVLSDIAPNAELVDHERTGLLTEVGNVEGLRDALQRVVDDPALREGLGIAARGDAQLSSWDVAAKATGELLRGAARFRSG